MLLRNVSGRAIDLSGAAVAVVGAAMALFGVGPEAMRALFLTGGLLFAPGYALVRLSGLGRGWKGAAGLALAFPLSCVVLFAPLFVCQVAGVGPSFLEWLAAPLLLLSALVLVRSARRERAEGDGPPVWLLAVALLVGILAFHGGALLSLSDDSLDHIAFLREIGESGKSFPVTAYYANSTDEIYDIRKGFLQPVFAEAAVAARVDPIVLWDVLPTLAALFFTFAYFAMAREALGPGFASAAALLIALLCYGGGINGSWFSRSGMPFLFVGPAVWTSFLLLLRASKARSGPAGLAGLAVCLGFAVMGCHVFAGIVVALLGAIYVAMLLLFLSHRAEGEGRGLPGVYLLFLVGLVPVGVWRFMTSYPPVDPIHTHLQGVVFVAERLYFATPFLVSSHLSLVGLAAIPLSLLLLRRVRRENGVLFAVATTLLPCLFVFNPLLGPLVVPTLGYLVGRVAWYGGNYLVLGALLEQWFREIRAGRPLGQRLLSGAALVLVLGVFATGISAGETLFSPSKMSWPGEPSPELWSDLFAYMDANLDPYDVVATDPVTGYLIPAFTRQKSVAILSQHSSPGDPRAPARLQDMIRVMSPYIDGPETAAILERHEADYVLLNFRLPGLATLYYGSVDPDLYEATLTKFRREPELYREVYTSDRCHLFRIEDLNRTTTAGAESVLTASLEAPPPEASPVNELFPNGVRLVSATVLTDSISGGEEAMVACYWQKVREADDSLPYRLYLRLDARERPQGSSAAFLGKLGRRWDQMRTGKAWRARTSRNLVRGSYPPFAWRQGEIVADTIRYRLPEDLAEGSYRVEMLLRRLPHMQVYYLRDFFVERDSFSGVPVGNIYVREERRA